jgi:hypothetical protein
MLLLKCGPMSDDMIEGMEEVPCEDALRDSYTTPPFLTTGCIGHCNTNSKHAW